jgi:hypothetical protein
VYAGEVALPSPPIETGVPTLTPTLPAVPSQFGLEPAAGPQTQNCTEPVTGPRLPLRVATSLTVPFGRVTDETEACVEIEGGGCAHSTVFVVVKLPVAETPGGDQLALATTVCVPAGTTIGTTLVAVLPWKEKLSGLPVMSTPSIVVRIVTVFVAPAGNAANE